MRRKSVFLLAVTVTLSVFAILLAVSRPTHAGAASGRILARSQFRRTVDPSPEGPVGDLLLVEDGGKQSLRAEVRDLNEDNLSLQISPTPFFDGTNTPVYYVTLMNRTGSKTGRWSRKLIGTNGAPLDLQVFGATNLSDLSNISSLQVGNPGSTNIVGGTNFLEIACNVISNQAICTTNTFIIGGVTNIYINAFVWAPIPTLAPNPSVFNFREKVKMDQPAIPPSPNATGTILMTYSGSSGRSLLDIRISNMIKGQDYALWVTDTGTNVQTGAFEPLGNPGGSGAKYRRDTHDGDPLPVQVPSTADLTNRLFQVRDGFGAVHLEGVVP